MDPEPEEYTTTCDWCQREVISFVQPPAMIEVRVMPSWPVQVYRVCALCHAKFIEFIASRSQDK